MTEYTNAGMSQHGGKLVSIRREKFSRDQKLSIFVGWRPQPRFQGKVHTFANSANADKKHGQALPLIATLAVRMITVRIDTIKMPQKFVLRIALIDKGL